jgi:hypothetical protein
MEGNVHVIAVSVVTTAPNQHAVIQNVIIMENAKLVDATARKTFLVLDAQTIVHH